MTNGYDNYILCEAVEICKMHILLDVAAGRVPEGVQSVRETRYPGDIFDLFVAANGAFSMAAIAASNSLVEAVDGWILSGGIVQAMRERDEHGHFYFE